MNTKIILAIPAIATVAAALVGVAEAQLAQTNFAAAPNSQVISPSDVGNHRTIPPIGAGNGTYAGPAYGYGPGCYSYGYGYGSQIQNQWAPAWGHRKGL